MTSENNQTELLDEIESLRRRLYEAESTLQAIGKRELDAFVVYGNDGLQVFTLTGADQAYRTLVETMNEGAVTLSTDGVILYANNRLATMLGLPLEKLVGTKLSTFIAPEDIPLFNAWLEKAHNEQATQEFTLITTSKTFVPVLFSSSSYKMDDNKGICLIITDLTQQKQYKNIVASEHLVRSIIEQAGEAILVCDLTGTIIMASQFAWQLCNKNPLLKPFNELFRLTVPETGERFSIESPLQGNLQKNMELEFRQPDGQLYSFLLNATPLTNNQNQIVGCVAILADFTMHKQTEDALNQARKAAENANRAKSEFLANMSHEIRTPMNGVIGMTQLLRFTDLTQEQEGYLENIEISAENLLQIINDILDLSKVEAGKIELEYTGFSLRKTIEDVITAQIPRICKKNLTIKKELPFDLPEMMHGDQLRLKQILLNLLGNAIKFTEQGSITITARLLEKDEQKALIRLTVSDTGIGIHPESLHKIFNPFEQADTSTTRRFGGTGLGLAICRSLINLMGGTISVESRLEEGSSFHIELPFLLHPSAPPLQNQTDKTLAQFEKPEKSLTILIAEDNQINQYTFTMILKKLGHQTVCSSNGKEALERWKAGDIDLILMDIHMPVMGGIESLAAIRLAEASKEQRTPVIALTADALKGTQEQLLKAGFDGYLTKPIDVSELYDTLILYLPTQD